MIAKSVRRMLEDFDVTVLDNGLEAFERISAGERFELILSDLSVPGMTGLELHAALEGTAPELRGRMVFMSGGASSPEMQSSLDRLGCPLLEKPFDRKTLFATITPLLG